MLNYSAAALKAVAEWDIHIKIQSNTSGIYLDLAPNMKLFLLLMLLVNAENQIVSRYDKWNETDSFQDNMSGTALFIN